MEKSNLTPFQVSTYLGIHSIQASGHCLSLREEDRMMAPHLRGLPSKTGSAYPAIAMTPGASSFFRENSFIQSVAYPTHTVQLCTRWSQDRDHPLIQVNLDQGTGDSIHWWIILTNLHKGIPLGTPQIDAFLFTDSISVGWGTHMAKLTASGRWSVAMKDLHINVLELHAIWLGLQDTLQDTNVAIMCHNVSAIAHLRNQGGTRSHQMCRMVIDTCKWAEKRSMMLIPRHLPGHINVLADHPSRRDQILKAEWSLNPAVARRVFRVWGSPQVDLFALKCNTKLATYMSHIRKPEKVDSLGQSWEGMYVYAHPPMALIKLILHRAELILIAPLWPKQKWFPDLLRLSIDFQLVLPPTAKLLKQSSHHFNQRPRFLNLHAWRLSVDPIKLEGFWNKCPTGSLFLNENLLLISTKRSGILLENGVRLTELIHTCLLSP